MPHAQYCLAHHPGISSNITNTTHNTVQLTTRVFPPISPTPLTLVRYSHYYTNHLTHTDTLPTLPTLARQPLTHVRTHARRPPKLARYPRKHTTYATHASMLPTQARHPRKYPTHVTHTSTNSTPSLKLQLIWSCTGVMATICLVIIDWLLTGI